MYVPLILISTVSAILSVSQANPKFRGKLDGWDWNTLVSSPTIDKARPAEPETESQIVRQRENHQRYRSFVAKSRRPGMGSIYMDKSDEIFFARPQQDDGLHGSYWIPIGPRSTTTRSPPRPDIGRPIKRQKEIEESTEIPIEEIQPEAEEEELETTSLSPFDILTGEPLFTNPMQDTISSTIEETTPIPSTSTTTTSTSTTMTPEPTTTTSTTTTTPSTTSTSTTTTPSTTTTTASTTTTTTKKPTTASSTTTEPPPPPTTARTIFPAVPLPLSIETGSQCCQWAAFGDCDRNPWFVKSQCPQECGVDLSVCPRNLIGVPGVKECATNVSPICLSPILLSTRGRSRSEPRPEPLNREWIREAQIPLIEKYCIDEDERCVPWAAVGECSRNPLWMHANCRQSCGCCDDGVCDGALENHRSNVEDNFGLGQGEIISTDEEVALRNLLGLGGSEPIPKPSIPLPRTQKLIGKKQEEKRKSAVPILETVDLSPSVLDYAEEDSQSDVDYPGVPLSPAEKPRPAETVPVIPTDDSLLEGPETIIIEIESDDLIHQLLRSGALTETSEQGSFAFTQNSQLRLADELEQILSQSSNRQQPPPTPDPVEHIFLATGLADNNPALFSALSNGVFTGPSSGSGTRNDPLLINAGWGHVQAARKRLVQAARKKALKRVVQRRRRSRQRNRVASLKLSKEISRKSLKRQFSGRQHN